MTFDKDQLRKTAKLQKLMRDPAAVQALIAENERLANDHGDMVLRNKVLRDRPDLAADRISCHDQVTELQAERDQLKAENASLNAQVDTLTEWYLNALKDAAAIGKDCDQIRAEVAGLKTGYEAYERVNAELKADVEVFQGLLREMRAIGNHAPAELTLRIDAALGKGEQS